MLDPVALAPLHGVAVSNGSQQGLAPQTVLTFDVEEHWRIEAAAGLVHGPERKSYYAARVGPAVRWLLDELARCGTRATFFILGELARQQPALVRMVHGAGHEVASHGWDHQRLHRLTPEQFREDLRRSKDALEHATGATVAGYRAPTFSVARGTAWALDVLVEEGFAYDSSIYPVWHDRYGVPGAPLSPFCASGRQHSILEMPPATLSLAGLRVPVGGGGYFRLLPLFLMEWAASQARRRSATPVTVLYFHPWEFDPEQDRLPLRPLGRWRTYAGLHSTRARFTNLVARHRFTRAIDVARLLTAQPQQLPAFALAP